MSKYEKLINKSIEFTEKAKKALEVKNVFYADAMLHCAKICVKRAKKLTLDKASK